MTLNQASVILHKYYKNHSRAALAMGFTPTHYRALRNGRYPISKRTETLIMGKAVECERQVRL